METALSLGQYFALTYHDSPLARAFSECFCSSDLSDWSCAVVSDGSAILLLSEVRVELGPWAAGLDSPQSGAGDITSPGVVQSNTGTHFTSIYRNLSLSVTLHHTALIWVLGITLRFLFWKRIWNVVLDTLDTLTLGATYLAAGASYSDCLARCCTESVHHRTVLLYTALYIYTLALPSFGLQIILRKKVLLRWDRRSSISLYWGDIHISTLHCTTL